MNSDVSGDEPSVVPATQDDASATWTWSYMQTVLDDALDAVHKARVRGEELSGTVDRYKRIVSELEDKCEALESRCDDARYDAESTEDTLGKLRAEHEALRERYAQALLTTMTVEDAVKRARRMEERLSAVAEAVHRLDTKVEEIHLHYGNDLDTQPELIEEINFARDEALEVIRRAVSGLRARAHA